MRPIVQEIETTHSPESLAGALGDAPGVVLLRSGTHDDRHARYSFVTAEPFLTFRSFGSRCEVTLPETRNPKPETRNSSSQTQEPRTESQFGNPWHLLDALMARYELLDELDLPFPLGGCFGCWGYDLKNFVEPRLTRRAVNDLELPDCHVGFYDGLVAFDHRLGKAWIISTGLQPDGSRSEERARARASHWQGLLSRDPDESELPVLSSVLRPPSSVTSTFTREGFIEAVRRAQHYIRHGHIYQVNLAQRFTADCAMNGWEFFQRLAEISPAPFAAYLDGGDFQLASSSPELFLRLSGAHITTRPIKGTRPRSADPTRDAQLTYELTTSPKEMAELVMITDLLRNDLGRVCEFGSVQVPELVRLERYAQVQHLVSTVEGRLRAGVTHFAALASCFPGGSITGAPKIRAMEIIDELEPVTRGPYTGAAGYLGFNRESQLSIAIRTAVLRGGQAHYHAGAGIVADSSPEAEYEETLAKARGFLAVLEQVAATVIRSRDPELPAP